MTVSLEEVAQVAAPSERRPGTSLPARTLHLHRRSRLVQLRRTNQHESPAGRRVALDEQRAPAIIPFLPRHDDAKAVFTAERLGA
jgi:hypothetical protein